MKRTKRRHEILLAIMAVIFLAEVVAPGARCADLPPLRIVGQVIDLSGAPIPGATVKTINEDSNSSMSVQTTNDGKFAIYCLSPATYTIVVTAQGFRTWIQHNLNITESEVLTLKPTLQVGSGDTTKNAGDIFSASRTTSGSGGGLIKGVVTNRQGEHIACAEVRAISSKSPKVASIGQTNLDGQFTFNEVLPGIYKVEVDSPQNEHWVLENLNVVPNSSNDLKVVLGGGVPNKGSVHTIPLVRYPPAALIVGRVLDDRGLFVHDAHVKIIDGSGRTVNSTIPCAMGFFQAYGLVPGTYTVEVFAPGYEKWVEPNVVAPGRNADSLDAKLTAKRVTQLTDKTSAQVFKGSVTDEAGNAISGANVQVTDEKSNATTVEQVNADGQFAFVGLAHGLYTIEITARDFETWVQKHIDVKGPGASELKAVMELVGVRHD